MDRQRQAASTGSESPTTKHTPGPWTATLARTLIHVHNAELGEPVVAISVSPPRIHERDLRDKAVATAHANARLISAAPDLFAYARCQEAWSSRTDGGDYPHGAVLSLFREYGYDEPVEGSVFLEDLRRAAIAKATKATGGAE